MAIHPNLVSLLRESVQECLEVAEYCVAYRKDIRWGETQAGGCLGYPAAMMLFSIVDRIGSFHRGRTDLAIQVDGKSASIRAGGFHHFFILNSEYYGQRLSQRTIKKLYDHFRSLFARNGSLAPGHFLLAAPGDPALFPVFGSTPCVNLPPFLEASRKAVELFLHRLDHLAPGSEQAKNIARKW